MYSWLELSALVRSLALGWGVIKTTKQTPPHQNNNNIFNHLNHIVHLSECNAKTSFKCRFLVRPPCLSSLLLQAITWLYLRRHLPEAGRASITNWVDHVAYWGTPGSTVLCELPKDFNPVLCPSSVAEDTLSGEDFQFCLDHDSQCLQLASSSSVPYARRCGQN